MKRTEIIRKILISSAAVCAPAIPIAIRLSGGDARLTAVSAVLAALLFGCLIGLDFWHRKHADDLLESLTLLIESLVDTRAAAPFPEDEDTLLSRLQNQLLKLRTILKSHLELLDSEKSRIQSLISDIAHQIKTPIAAARAYCELLREEGLSDAERRDRLNTLQNALDKLTFLTEDLIQLSRLEGGLIQLEPRPVDLGGLLLAAIKQIYPRAREKQLDLQYAPAPSPPIRADARWTAEAIVNILDNAVKYTPPQGRIALTVSELPSYVRLDVFSASPAIPEAEQAKIFGRFYRGSASDGQEGVGIGLYLAREILTRQGGFIRLTAEPDGNTFSLFLRRDTPEPDESAAR